MLDEAYRQIVVSVELYGVSSYNESSSCIIRFYQKFTDFVYKVDEARLKGAVVYVTSVY